MKRYQLADFSFDRNPHSGDLLLLLEGPTLYKSILSRAFAPLYFSRTFEDRYGKYDWGTYIKGANDDDLEALTNFCTLLQSVVFIDDDLDESFALAFHTRTSASGGYERSSMGQLVREAKPYDRGWNAGSQSKAKELADLMANFVRSHPTYARADLIGAVPPSNPNKPFDLPTYLVEAITKSTDQTSATTSIAKVRTTSPMKDCRTIQEKIDNIKDAFEVDASIVREKTVILIDDIYQTGFSINEVGRMLQQAGARLVLGLVATKTTQDLSEPI